MANNGLIYFLKKVNERYSLENFFVDTFFTRSAPVAFTSIDISTVKSTNGIAPYVSFLKQGEIVESMSESITEVKPVYQQLLVSFTAEDMITTPENSAIYVNQNTQVNLLAQKIDAELDDKIPYFARRTIQQCVESVTTGKITAKGKSIERIIDYAFNANQFVILAGGNLWSDTANSKPLEDFKTWNKVVKSNTGLKINIAIGDELAINALVKHPDFQAGFKGDDNYKPIIYTPHPVEKYPDATYIGRLIELGVDIYCWDGDYTDKVDGVKTAKQYMPTGTIVVGNSTEKGSVEFGAIVNTNIPTGKIAVEVYVQRLFDKNGKGMTMPMESNSLAVPTNKSNFLTAKVV